MKKLTLKDELQAWAGSIGLIGGLFLFGLLCGVLFMDYDPMTMVNGIKSDLRAIIEGVSGWIS